VYYNPHIIAIAAPCENPPTRTFVESPISFTSSSITEVIRSAFALHCGRLIAFSISKFPSSFISNHAGISIPKLIVTGIDSAVKRTTFVLCCKRLNKYKRK
jgi:hypothetical protein